MSFVTAELSDIRNGYWPLNVHHGIPNLFGGADATPEARVVFLRLAFSAAQWQREVDKARAATVVYEKAMAMAGRNLRRVTIDKAVREASNAAHDYYREARKYARENETAVREAIAAGYLIEGYSADWYRVG